MAPHAQEDCPTKYVSQFVIVLNTVVTTCDPPQDELQIVDVTVLNPANPLVQVAFPWQEEDDINIMFGKVASLSSSCQGESGSPLTTYDDRNVATLRALASFGTGTCDPEAPIGFTRVDTGDTLHWIKENSMQREIHYPSEPLLDIDFIY